METSKELDFLHEKLESLEAQRVNLVSCLAQNQEDIRHITARIQVITSDYNHEEGCHCLDCEGK